jgi:hypothetical protein
MNEITDIALFNNLRDDEPRVLDTDLGERLGMANPRFLRHDIIEVHREELEEHGPLHFLPTNPGIRGGRPGRVYYLNEAQALLVALLSRAPRAAEVRHMLIMAFMAWRRGQLVPISSDPALAALAWAEEYRAKQLALKKPMANATVTLPPTSFHDPRTDR